MQPNKSSILSIAPYRLLPPKSGGQLGIVHTHHYLGQLCPDHVAGTVDNDEEHSYAFQLHKVFPGTALRYTPFHSYSALRSIGKRYDVTHIICEHPYMAPTAMLLSRSLHVPWFLRGHNIESLRFKDLGKKWWRLLYYYEQMAMRNAYGVFLPTAEDAQVAQQKYSVNASRCHVLPFGTPIAKMPEIPGDIKEKTGKQLNINPAKPWLYFLGALDYAPNTQAVLYILEEIIPRLNKKDIPYQVLIAGKGLPEDLKIRIENTPGIKYTGFLPDIDNFIKACDVMLNPVLQGGGIKTKAVEALGYNKNVVSCYSGAVGLIREACGTNLLVSADNDWDAFTEDVVRAMHRKATIPELFYQTYYWGNIARKMLGIMQAVN